MRTIILMTMYMFLTLDVQATNPCHEWYSNLEKGLTAYQANYDFDSADIAAWKLCAGNLGESPFFPNESDLILDLWRAKQFDFLKLLWWSTREREKRLLILSLFLGSDLEGQSSTPPFELYCSRFGTKEAKEREEEIKCVEKHQKNMHILLSKYYLLPWKATKEELNKIKLNNP